MRRAIRAILIVVCAIVATPLLIRAYFILKGPDDSWKQRTTALPSETVKLLCQEFKLSAASLCSGTQAVYGPDFYNAIRNTFRPYEEYGILGSAAASYDEVEQKLGVFRYACDAVVHATNAPAYFLCYYDLRGDRVFTIAIMFTDPDKRVWRIHSPLGLDDE
jgi:hypothetical protein